MIRFILNEQMIETSLPSGSTVLDFIRYHQRLPGTKIGCREGDCGACTILVGDCIDGELHYQTMTSCLMPMGNANGKHIVTVEGINMASLSPVQQAIVDNNGTQCGFCTPGFVMSLTGFLLEPGNPDHEKAIAAIDGNICRCTGYKSIERAAALLTKLTGTKPEKGRVEWLVQHHFIPDYFLNMAERLASLKREMAPEKPVSTGNMMIGGGTDLVVQKHLAVKKSILDHVYDEPSLQEIIFENGRIRIGASVTVTRFAGSSLVRGCIPELDHYIKLISSTPIRNMATLAGNLVNASPIGDMTIFLLALDATVLLSDGEQKREIRLRDFYLGYKQLDKKPGEWIEAILFEPPNKQRSFHFEKVSKRTHLDIASVNSACLLQMSGDGVITELHLSAGGVAPYPKYLAQTVSFLTGKKPNPAILNEAIRIMNSEIAPISDARGTKEYKRLLLRQLFLSHMMKLAGAETAVKEILIT